MQLSSEQFEAIELCADITKRLVCVTGQAGTGKTTILENVHKHLTEIFPSSNPDFPRVMLAAPTGRAAQRIKEATGITAMTIHRMLRFTAPLEEDDQTLPRHDRTNPMPYDAILIDEASMVSQELHDALMAALKRGAIIRFFGDINQLPPVVKEGKPISPFGITMKKFPTRVLTHNYRSDDGIISVSDRIIKGRIPTANDKVKIFRMKSAETMYCLRDLCDEWPFTRTSHQIICPTTSTKYGTAAINTFIQQRYNPETDKIKTFRKNYDTTVTVRSFKRGDKVIWTKNNYDLGLMKGIIGVVNSFDHETGSIFATFDNTYDLEIPSQIEGYNATTGERFMYDPRTQMELAYAITTHKSQGSQFDTVLYICTRSRAATRQNLYTAVTRAKTNLLIFNVAQSLVTALNTKIDVGV